MSRYTIGLIGNPNCGKTTLFNALTGLRQKVGNWPGVTVDRKMGYFELGDDQVEVVDLPGTYSLDAVSSASLDEAIAREYALSGEADVIVNIVDASNLERNLYLTTQLMEMRVPLVLAVNMLDLAARPACASIAEAGETTRLPRGAACRGQGRGGGRTQEARCRTGRWRIERGVKIEYAPLIEKALAVLEPLVRDFAAEQKVDARWLGVKLLENDPGVLAAVDAACAPRPSGCRKRSRRIWTRRRTCSSPMRVTPSFTRR